MKLKIPQKLTVDSIENFLGKIQEPGTVIELVLPNKIDYRGFGVFPSFFLFLFTWMRNHKGNVVLNLKPEEYAEFATNYYGYTLLSTLWRHCKILNQNGDDIKLDFKGYTSQMHFYIDSLASQLPHEALVIPNFDHYSKDRGLSHWFYTNNYEFVKTPSSLENAVYHILAKVRTNNEQRLNRNVSNSFDSITTIIWELLKNTDEHGTKDYLDEAKLLPNTRGVFIRIHRSSKNGFVDSTDHSGMKIYFDHALPQEDQVFILEISVFDSGPGLVKRFLGHRWKKGLDLADEVSTIKRCLIKGQTSVLSSEGKNKGYGLDEVLSLLDEKNGFLKIRTERTSLYRDLITSPYVKTDDIEKVELYDWITQTKSEFTEMPTVDGTLITLAFPLL